MLIRAVLVLATAVTARPGSVQRVEHKASDMVRIPAGEFTMGFAGSVRMVEHTLIVDRSKVTSVEPKAEPEDAELEEITEACVREFGPGSENTYCREELLVDPALPAREVFLPAYDIDRYEVTVGQYRACAAAGGCDVGALVSGDERYVRDESFPMVYVTWQDAADYCAWAGKRMPTEAEIEKAARGTDGRRWPWGNHERADGANHGTVQRDPVRGPVWGNVYFVGDDTDGYAGPAPVGAMKWTDSEYGVYDLAGNVSEWAADFYREGYADASTIDPLAEAPGEGAALRVYRGGSWAEPKLFGRTYFRSFADPEQRAFDRGFRCARDVD